MAEHSPEVKFATELVNLIRKFQRSDDPTVSLVVATYGEEPNGWNGWHVEIAGAEYSSRVGIPDEWVE